MDKLLHLSEFSGKPKGCLAGQWKCTITLSTKLNTRCSFYFHYMCTTPKQNQSINQSTPTIFHSVIRTTDNNEFGYPVFSSYYHRRSFSDFSTAAAAFLQAQCCTWLSLATGQPWAMADCRPARRPDIGSAAHCHSYERKKKHFPSEDLLASSRTSLYESRAVFLAIKGRRCHLCTVKVSSKIVIVVLCIYALQKK